MYVTLLMDVEDLIAPEADDIARTCADILAEEGVRITMCIVGEKARLLARRGRADVIAALRQHDLGVHTDFHSVHPTIAEYLGDKGWEDGVAEALTRERPGIEAIRDVFGVEPSCWGGPGNTWGPQIGAAIRQLGVPAFVYAHTRVPQGGVHRFTDILAYPGGRALSDGRYHDDALAAEDRARLCRELQTDREAGVFWQEVFIGHPTRILHESFWDAANFADGANPPRDTWQPAPRKPQADLDRALKNFRESVRTLKALPGIELRTIREMNALLAEAPSAPLTEAEQTRIWPEIEKNLRGMTGWPILPRHFDVSRILAATRAQLPTLQRLDSATVHSSLANFT